MDRDAMAQVQRQLVDEGAWLRPFWKLLYTMPLFNCKELNNEHMKKIGEAMFKVASKLWRLYFTTHNDYLLNINPNKEIHPNFLIE